MVVGGNGKQESTWQHATVLVHGTESRGHDGASVTGAMPPAIAA